MDTRGNAVEQRANEAKYEGRPNAEADRYTGRNILRFEEVYGSDFQSPGGRDAMSALCRRAQMRWGMTVLDIGSGLGGASFYFAEKFGATVVGVDASPAMIALSTERAARKRIGGVSFVHADIRTARIERESVDLAWSRDSVLYVAEKGQVWQNVHAALKPGGQLIVIDVCRGKRPASEAFEEHVSQCGYHLQEIDGYQASLRGAGFEPLVVEDITAGLIALLHLERQSLRARRGEFCVKYGRADFDYLLERWSKKIAFCEGGDLKWGLFVAKRGLTLV